MMILPVYLKDLEGSTVRKNYIGPKNVPFILTYEFQKRSFDKINIDGLKSGKTHRITLERVIAIVKLDSDFTVLNSLQDGSGAAIGLIKEVIK